MCVIGIRFIAFYMSLFGLMLLLLPLLLWVVFFLFPFYYRAFKRHFEQTQFNLARCMEQQQQQQQHTFRPLTMRTWLEPRTGRNAMCVHIISSIFRLLFSSMRIRKLIFGRWKRERKIALNQTDQIKLTDRLLTANKIHGKMSVSYQMEKQKRILFLSFQGKQQIKHIYI